MKRSSKNVLMLVAGLIVLMIAYRLIFPPPIPDDQQIKNEIASSAVAAEAKDTGGITRPLSQQFVDGNGYTADQLRFMLGRNIRNFTTITVTVSSISVTVNGDNARSEQYVTVEALSDDGNSVKYHGPMNLEWKKEPATRLLFIPTQVWRVVKSDVGIGTFD